MATLPNLNPTLVDITKRLDPNGSVAMIAEMLSETNEMLDDIPWIEGNGTASHRVTIRTGLPTPTWRRLYQGIQPSKSQTAQVDESMGMLEALGEIDKAAADLNGNTQAFRLSEDKAHIQGMSHALAETLFTGNDGANAERFLGLAPRFNSRAAAVANSVNIIHAGGAAADNASIWLVGWSEQSVFGLYPKGSKAGLQSNDLGQQLIQRADGSKFMAYITHFKWDCGLCVKDWRYVVRIANISMAGLQKDAALGGADLVDHMTDAVERIQTLTGVRPAFYVPRRVSSFLRRQIRNSKNVNLTLETVAGKKVMMFDGVPVRRSDALKYNEAVVPA